MDEQERIRWMEQYRESEREIERIQEEIAYWNSRAQKVTAAIAALPRSSVKEDPLQVAVEKLDELRETLGKRFEAFVMVRREIGDTVAMVKDSTLRELLRLRYFDRLTWEKVADRMGFAERQVYRLHKKALGELKIKIENMA